MEIILITEESQVEMVTEMDCSPGDCSPVNIRNPNDEDVDQDASGN